MKGRSALAVERELLEQSGAFGGAIATGNPGAGVGAVGAVGVAPETVERFKPVTEIVKTTSRPARAVRPERCCVHCGFGMYILQGGAHRVLPEVLHGSLGAGCDADGGCDRGADRDGGADHREENYAGKWRSWWRPALILQGECWGMCWRRTSAPFGRRGNYRRAKSCAGVSTCGREGRDRWSGSSQYGRTGPVTACVARSGWYRCSGFRLPIFRFNHNFEKDRDTHGSDPGADERARRF